jgi:hypothetical protein
MHQLRLTKRFLLPQALTTSSDDGGLILIADVVIVASDQLASYRPDAATQQARHVPESIVDESSLL